MNRVKVIALMVLMVWHVAANGSEIQSRQVSSLANDALAELQTWQNQKLKALLQYRMSENQYLLSFINEFHESLAKTELDSTYEYFVQSLIEDQKGLAFVSTHLNLVDSAESLDLDGFLNQKPNLEQEVNQALANNLRIESGKAVVNRVLYYSLMNKYMIQ